MDFQIIKVALEEIQPFRVLFLHERNFQFIYDKCHYYGWADTYTLLAKGKKVGYISVWGTNDRKERDSIFEFYLLPAFQEFSRSFFELFLSSVKVDFIESQSNDGLLTSMLHEYSQNIIPEAILFEDHCQTQLQVPGVIFGRNNTNNPNPADNDGYYLKLNEEIVATGGFLTNYNPPYADIYMDVAKTRRHRGFGSLIVQELKKEIYWLGKKPAARCNYDNIASKATILKAGFRVCGLRLKGQLKK
jgi:hypothetical protein